MWMCTCRYFSSFFVSLSIKVFVVRKIKKLVKKKKRPGLCYCGIYILNTLVTGLDPSYKLVWHAAIDKGWNHASFPRSPLIPEEVVLQFLQVLVKIIPLTPVKPFQLLEVFPPLLHIAQGQVDDLSVGQGGLSGFYVKENFTPSADIDSALLVGYVQGMGRREVRCQSGETDMLLEIWAGNPPWPWSWPAWERKSLASPWLGHSPIFNKVFLPSCWWKGCVLCSVAKLCLILCNPMDCSLPGSSVHGISQARILEQVAISFSRGSFWPRDWTHISCISCISRQIHFFTTAPPRKVLEGLGSAYFRLSSKILTLLSKWWIERDSNFPFFSGPILIPYLMFVLICWKVLSTFPSLPPVLNWSESQLHSSRTVGHQTMHVTLCASIALSIK